jgi:hypothetical protein
MGRLFRDGEAGTAVVSDEFWRQHLLAHLNPLGKTIVLGGEPHIVVGLLPAGFCLSAGPFVGLASACHRRSWRRRPPSPARATPARRTDSDGSPSPRSPPGRHARVSPRDGRRHGPNRYAGSADGRGVDIGDYDGKPQRPYSAADDGRLRELAVRSALGASPGQIARQVLIDPICSWRAERLPAD